MMCMSQSTNRSPSFMASSSASRSVLRSRLRSALVRRIHALEPAQQPRPHARALALARDRLLEDVLGHRDQLAARLRAHLDRARRLEVVHGHPRVGHRLADRQQPVVPQDERGLVAEVGHEARIALWITKPAGFTSKGEWSIFWPLRSIFTRLEAVISSKKTPYGLIRNWSSASGTRSVMCVKTRSSHL